VPPDPRLLRLCRTDKEGLNQCWHFEDKWEGVNFLRFCTYVFYRRPLIVVFLSNNRMWKHQNQLWLAMVTRNECTKKAIKIRCKNNCIILFAWDLDSICVNAYNQRKIKWIFSLPFAASFLKFCCLFFTRKTVKTIKYYYKHIWNLIKNT